MNLKRETESWSDRRTERRYSVAGEVRLWQDSPDATFSGRLLDSASTGFRARHDKLSLASGQLVNFLFGGRSGIARVVWTRIFDGEAETGFRILPADSSH